MGSGYWRYDMSLALAILRRVLREMEVELNAALLSTMMAILERGVFLDMKGVSTI